MQPSFVDEGITEEELNYDCNHNLVLTKSLLGTLSNAQDRQKVVRWLQKLATPTTDLEEMGLRNIFVYYLAVNVQQAKLKAPFNREPPLGSLMALKNLLADKSSEPSVITGDFEESPDSSVRKKSGTERRSTPTLDQARPIIYQQSPDGGAFLAAQPVPRCGAFCYLAVVARNSHV